VPLVRSLPESDIYLLVRTWFGDETAWRQLQAVIDEGSDEGFSANVEYVDDRTWDGFSVTALEAVHPNRESGWDVMYVADQRAVTEPAHPLLVVRVGSTVDAPFRCRADLLYEIDANLSLANLDWDDFASDMDESGVYGGVEDPSTLPAAPENAAVAAYRRGSDRLLTISLPSVPESFWFRITNELEETGLHSIGETGLKDVTAIADRIVSRDREQPPRMTIEDDAVITLKEREWAFIIERMRRLETRTFRDAHDDGRPDGPTARRIVDLLTRYVPGA
jgi:hypothetical protein